jgi:GAF domain-containing protein
MIIALALGLSMRYIHGVADRLVDGVFFRKRHEDEAALRRFAHESSYISDPQVLLDRAGAEVKAHTSAEEVAIYTSDGSPAYAASNGSRRVVGENDPAIVALRAWGKPVHLHEVSGSELNGELAFPMISRGRLVGTLICGARRDGEAYAPDEYDALVQLAHGVGTTFDTLSSVRAGAARGTEAKLDLILAKLAAIEGEA